MGRARNFEFFPSPAANFILSSLSGGSSRGIVAAVRGHGPPTVCVWASQGSFCASPNGGAVGPRKGSESNIWAMWRDNDGKNKRKGSNKCLIFGPFFVVKN